MSVCEFVVLTAFTGSCLTELQSENQSSEELAQAEKNLAEAAARRRLCKVPTPNGGEIVFEICVEDKWTTNGGWIFDILVSKDDKETV
jgi:hypothetical protein